MTIRRQQPGFDTIALFVHQNHLLNTGTFQYLFQLRTKHKSPIRIYWLIYS